MTEEAVEELPEDDVASFKADDQMKSPGAADDDDEETNTSFTQPLMPVYQSKLCLTYLNCF